MAANRLRLPMARLSEWRRRLGRSEVSIENAGRLLAGVATVGRAAGRVEGGRLLALYHRGLTRPTRGKASEWKPPVIIQPGPLPYQRMTREWSARKLGWNPPRVVNTWRRIGPNERRAFEEAGRVGYLEPREAPGSGDSYLFEPGQKLRALYEVGWEALGCLNGGDPECFPVAERRTTMTPADWAKAFASRAERFPLYQRLVSELGVNLSPGSP